LPIALLLAAGCLPTRSAEILESRLRQQEDRLTELQSQLSEANSELRVARRETDALRTQLANRGEPTLLPEQADALYRVTSIELSKLLTGSIDRDGLPGDDLLSAVILPHDEQGSLVKVAGAVELELLDLAQPEGARRIGHWIFDADETRTHWQRSLIGSGYVFQLPWQQKPTSSRLLIHVQLTTIDGRRFETSRQFTVNLSANTTAISTQNPSAPNSQ
jgi:hypothetical protein